MVYQVAPQEILCQLPGLFMTVMTQRSSVRAKWWEVTARQANRDRSWKESAENVAGRWDSRVRAGPLVSFLFPSAFVGTHFLLICLNLLLSASLTLFPLPSSHALTFSSAHTLSTELEDKCAIFIDEWFFWDYLGNLDTFWDLGEFRGKKWPHWGFLSIKWNTHKSMLLLSFQERAVSTQGLTLKTSSI